MKKPVPIDSLTPAMLKKHPVWEFAPESSERDETWVQPMQIAPGHDRRH